MHQSKHTWVCHECNQQRPQSAEVRIASINAQTPKATELLTAAMCEHCCQKFSNDEELIASRLRGILVQRLRGAWATVTEHETNRNYFYVA